MLKTNLRRAEPEHISGVATYLASPAPRIVTGITHPVDGEWLGQ